MRQFYLLLILCGIGLPAFSQSYAFGLKGGSTLGFQRWENTQREVLFKYHGILFIESADDYSPFSIFAQLGYHQKGSATRSRFSTILNGRDWFAPLEYVFNNISLSAGGKKRILSDRVLTPYYLFGVRGDYTVSTNLSEYEDYNNSISPFFPFEGFVNRWGYGVILGAGFDVPFSDLVGGLVELTLNPNFSRQYFQPPIPNVINPYQPGNTITLRERSVYNITVELTLGFRFLHKIEYIE